MPTGIPYCDEVWNPVVGCSPKSEGCRHCWAARMAHRGMCPQHRGVTKMTENGPVWNGKVNLVPSLLEQPRHWRKPRRIFVGSMTDLFYEKVPMMYLRQVFRMMEECPQHTFMIFTKRPERAAEFFEQTRHKFMWPLPNVWLITSAEDQKTYNDRVMVLVHKCPGFVKGVSLEPLLGPVDLRATGRMHLSWVIIGGEAGSGARLMEMIWAENLIDQSQENDVATYFKQTGDVLARELGLVSRSGSDPEEWPEHLQIQEYPHQ